MVCLSGHNLGRGVMGGSTAGFQHSISLQSSHTKVGNLDVAVLVQQQILGLEISVTNVESVAVVDSIDDLQKVRGGLVFLQTALFDQIVKQLAALNVFQNEISVLVIV